MIDKDAYTSLDAGKPWSERGFWPCNWIGCGETVNPPCFTAYRRRFTLNEGATVRVHVSADERYELFMDGVRIGRGSERGDRENWFYETYDLELGKGGHVIVARVWSLGDVAAYAQMSVCLGFILSAEGEFVEMLGTGVAEWEAKKLDGYEAAPFQLIWGTGARVNIDGSVYPWGFEKGEGDGWGPVDVLHAGTNGFIRNEFPPIHMMKPATLPPMIEREARVGVARFVSEVASDNIEAIPVRSADNIEHELEQWNLIKTGGSVTVPANTRRRVVIDLEDYYCAYPEITTSGGRGSVIRVYWAEALHLEPGCDTKDKGNRNETEGKYFVGAGDTFKPDGGPMRRFDSLWWAAGRYIEVLVRTADEPLTIGGFKLRETRYPLEMESSFESSDARLEAVVPIALRGLQMCSHETYMDCPYYEQLMYVGDTRLEALTTYAITRDDRLPRKALRMFDASRRNSGITQSRYPSRVTQIIPPFSLWWVGMVYDYSIWRDDMVYVKSLMPGMRSVIECYLTCLNSDSLIQAPNGWNFTDWVSGWVWGIPLDGEFGVSGVLNWHLVLALKMAAELEDAAGDAELAARDRRYAHELAERISAAFWDESRNLWADDLSKTHFSEHAQCLAILSGQADPNLQTRASEALLTDPDLARTTIYYTHYLFETYRILGRIDALFERLALWFDLEKHGFKTTFEEPEPSRSDCHAWGAHPLHHCFASILGIRPASPGFRAVRIEPQLGPLTSAKGILVHPHGEIDVNFSIKNGELDWTISLPEGVTGTLVYGGKTVELRAG